MRIASGVLLLGAVACGVVGMTTIGFSQSLISVLQLLPGQRLPDACVSGGIATYSGISLALSTAPSVNTECLQRLHDGGGAAVGVQPLVLVAFLLIVVGVLVNVWNPPSRRTATMAASLLSAALLVVDQLRFGAVFETRFGLRAGSVAASPASGFWLALALVVLACLANLVPDVNSWVSRALAPLEEPEGPPRR